VRDRTLELEHFLSQHVNICLLRETFLNPGQAFRHANYVCQRTEGPTAGADGTAIIVRRGIVQDSLPVPGLTNLEATAVQDTLPDRRMKILTTYLSPSRLLIGTELTACFDGGLPVLIAGDLNAKRVDWNSRLTTRRGKSFVIMQTITSV